MRSIATILLLLVVLGTGLMYYSNRYVRIKEMFRGGGGGGHGGGGHGGGGHGGGGHGGGGHGGGGHGGGGHGGGGGGGGRGGWTGYGGWGWNWIMPGGILVVDSELAVPEVVEQPCTMDLECPSGRCSMWGTCL